MTDSAKANDLLAQLPKGKGPATCAFVEPGFLRRHRHAHRP